MSGDNIDTIALDKPILDSLNTVKNENVSLDVHAKGLVVSQLVSLKDKTAAEITTLKDRQQRLQMTHGLMRTINECSDENNGLDWVNNARLKEYRQKSLELLEEVKKLEEQAAAAEKNGNKEEAKKIQEKATELLEVARAMGAEWKGDKFNKEQKEKLSENLRSAAEDINALSQMQSQTVQRYNNELHEAHLMGRDIMKRLHEIKSRMARNISGSG